MCLAEIVGTYLLVLLGCGVVHASVLNGAQSGLWQVAIAWGIAIMLAVYTTVERRRPLLSRCSRPDEFDGFGAGCVPRRAFGNGDPRNGSLRGHGRAQPERSSRGLAPAFIGLTVAVLISVIAPLTQACFNPARDFGPRLFAFLAGWGPIALPGPRDTGFLTVYIIAPVSGAIVGSGLYSHLLHSSNEEPGGIVS
jgi:glycerol uptake facilitator-like aquaporin